VIDRLVEGGLVEGYWEQQEPQDNRPRRRYYRLTDAGVPALSQLLARRGR
jgi:DNA-binding PadR family transcriptional regulator